MNEAELERLEIAFAQIVTLQKQFKSLLERQTPYAVDVTSLLQRFDLSMTVKELIPSNRICKQTEDVLFRDLEYALNKTLEERLWTHVQYRVIDDYRKRIAAVFLT